MPAISAVPFTTVPAVRILLNWADTPGATHATVFRIDCETGEEVQLRPYIAYNSDGYIRLSCGQAVIWDTEVPFDRCVRYCTRAETTAGLPVTTTAAATGFDDFTRNVANSWGVATSGQTYSTSGGVPADFLVNGAKGFQTNSTVNVLRLALLPLGLPVTRIRAKINSSVLATGSSLSARIALAQDFFNYYGIFALLTTAGTVTLQLNKNIGGVGATIGSVANIGSYAAGTQYWMEFEQFPGGTPRGRMWLVTDPEPDWQVVAPAPETQLTNLTQAGMFSRAEAGNTNVNPIIAFDDMTVWNECDANPVVESCSDDLMVGSSGWNMLRDPLRPCNDVRVGVCWTPEPGCVPGHGVFFQRLEAEGYGANSQNHQAFNAARPTTASRERSDAASTLVLVSRTFEDRDAVLDVLRAGTPLLWQSPPEYGIPDRYIQVGDVSVARYNPDHRYQPRTFTLPFVTVDRPEGPAQGICGARVADLCDTYATWGAMATAGLSYQELLLGHASPAGPPDTGRRRWGDVEANFANWLAVETVPNTWKTLRDGS